MAFENYEKNGKPKIGYDCLFQDIFKRLDHLDKKQEAMGKRIEYMADKLFAPAAELSVAETVVK